MAIKFSKRLKEVRAKAGLSQNNLADKSGIPVATIRDWEYGRREPLFASVIVLCVAMQIELAYFWTLADSTKRKGK